MNLDFLQGWIIYPFAEFAHAIQGLAVGMLSSRAIISKNESDAIVALLWTVAFLSYEISEQWKINDSAFQDIENFYLAAVASGILYALFHFRKHIKNRWIRLKNSLTEITNRISL